MRPDLKQIILTDIEIPQECKKRQFIGVDLAPKATALSRWLRNEEQLLRDVRVSVSQGRKMMIHQLEDSSVFSYPNQRFVGMWLVYRGEDLYEVCTSIKTGQRESNVLNLRMRRNLECKNKFTKGTGRILEGTGGDKWGIYPLFLMSSPAATESLFWVQLPRESPSMQNLTTVLIPRMHLASKAPSHQFLLLLAASCSHSTPGHLPIIFGSLFLPVCTSPVSSNAVPLFERPRKVSHILSYFPAISSLLQRTNIQQKFDGVKRIKRRRNM